MYKNYLTATLQVIREHYLIATLIVIYIVFLSLRDSQPTTEELVSKYTAAPDSYESLRKLIIEDTGNKECFVVGLDNIGEYWESHGEWTHSRDYANKKSLSGVLKSVGLTEGRYEEYKKLFAKTGSERIRFCHAQKFGAEQVTVLVYRAGLAVSGCSGEMNWRKEPPPAPNGKRGEGDFTEITPLSNGWYFEYECT